MTRGHTSRTPQARTREYLTNRGYLVGTVEKKKKFPDRFKSACPACGHVPMIEISSDLWEVFDVIGIHPSGILPVMFVQTTTRPNHASRRNKILASMESKLVLMSGAVILLQSWAKDEDLGRYVAKDEYITLKDFKSALHYPNDVAGLVEIKRRAKRPDLPPGSTLPLVGDEKDLPPRGKTRYMPVIDSEIPF